MHGQFEKPKKDDSSGYQKIGVGFLVLPVCIVVALMVVAIVEPSTSNWISEAVQAEFVGDTLPGEVPTQLAEPTRPRNMTASWPNEIRTAHRDQR